MKTSLRFQSRRCLKRQEGAVAVIIMLALLLMIVIYLGANTRSLNSLHRELKLVEQKQVARLATIHSTMPILQFTNLPAAVTNIEQGSGTLSDNGSEREPASSQSVTNQGTGNLP